MVGCTLQASKRCTCPASRPTKEPRVSDRDIIGLRYGGGGGAESYKPEERSWSSTPPCPTDARHGSTIYYPREEEGPPPFVGGNDVRKADPLPGKPAAEARPSRPLRLTSILRAGAFLS